MHLITGSIFSGLVGIDFNLNPVPDLAENWEVSPDGARYVFRLAPNATFHDGRPVTSADVKFTFEIGKTAPVNISTVWRYLDSITQVDDQTLQFNFKTTLYQQWGNTLYTTAIVPEHIWSKFSADEMVSGANDLERSHGRQRI